VSWEGHLELSWLWLRLGLGLRAEIADMVGWLVTGKHTVKIVHSLHFGGDRGTILPLSLLTRRQTCKADSQGRRRITRWTIIDYMSVR